MSTQKDDFKERYIKIEVDYAPKVNGKEFEGWCEKYGFNYLASGRRAWCNSLNSYFADADGVAFSENGEMFLFYEEESVNLDTLLKQAELGGRLDELRKLTEWRLGVTDNDDYDILRARHRRSYDDRIYDLTKQLEEIELARKKNHNNPKQELREYLKSNGLLWHESHVITDDCMDELEAHVEQLLSDTVNKVLDELDSKAKEIDYGVGCMDCNGVDRVREVIYDVRKEWK